MYTPSRELAGLENLTVSSTKKSSRTARSNSFHASPYRNVSKPESKVDSTDTLQSAGSRAARKLPLFAVPGVDSAAEENLVPSGSPSRKEPSSPVKPSTRPHKKGRALQMSAENAQPRERSGSLIERPVVPTLPQPKERRYRTLARRTPRDGYDTPPVLDSPGIEHSPIAGPALERRPVVPPLALGSIAAPQSYTSPVPMRSAPASPLALSAELQTDGPPAVTSSIVTAPAVVPASEEKSRRPSLSRRRSFIGGLLALVTPRGSSPSARDRSDSFGSAPSSSASSVPQLDDPELYYGAVGVFGERRTGSPGPQPIAMTASSTPTASSAGGRGRSASSPAPPLVRTDSSNGPVMPTAGTLPKLLQWLLDLQDEKMEQRFFLAYTSVGSLSDLAPAFLELYKSGKTLAQFERLKSVIRYSEFFTRWIIFTAGTARSRAVATEALLVTKEMCLDCDDAISREAHRLFRFAHSKAQPAAQPTATPPVERFSTSCDMPFLSLNITDAAKCLTKMERQLFVAVPEEEWLSCGWLKTNRSVYPTLHLSICHFNRVSHWVTATLLRTAESKERIEVIRRMMKLAKQLQRMHNYNTLMAVLCGLSQTSVSKLPEWDKLTSKRLEHHLQLLDPSANSRNYREVYQKNFSSISVPYICLFLKDIGSAMECNASHIEGGLINWQRLYLVGGFLYELRTIAQREIVLLCSEDTSRYFASLPDPPE